MDRGYWSDKVLMSDDQYLMKNKINIFNPWSITSMKNDTDAIDVDPEKQI
jgi:hypothetical protein